MNLLFCLYWIPLGCNHIAQIWSVTTVVCVCQECSGEKDVLWGRCLYDPCKEVESGAGQKRFAKAPLHIFLPSWKSSDRLTDNVHQCVLHTLSVLLYVRKECDEVFDALMLHSPTLKALMAAVRMSFYCLNGDVKRMRTLWYCWTSSTDLRKVFGPNQQNQSIPKKQERVSWHVELFILLSVSLFHGWNWSILEYSCIIREDFSTWLLS